MSTFFVRRGWLAVFLILLLAVAALPPLTSASSSSNKLTIRQSNSEYALSTPELGTFHRTANKVENARLIAVPRSRAQLALWQERQADGRLVPFYAVSLDGQTVARVAETSYDIKLRYAQFDPATERPSIPENLKGALPGAGSVYIVQFVAQPLEEFRQQITERGGTIYTYLANHAYLVQMNPQTRAQVEALPFVRFVGEYQPAYRLEEYLLQHLNPTNFDLPTMRYNILVLERGTKQEDAVARRIKEMGGTVEQTIPQGFRIEATLTPAQLLEVSKMNEVLFIDRWSAPEADMDIVRSVGGANFIENTLGFNGQGVRAEVMDGNMLATHQDFQDGLATLFHGAHSDPDVSHGTCTFGIVFGSGAGNAQARGMLPGAQKIFASYISLTNRYTHTQELVAPPYNAVFQSNSWGDALTTSYSTISAEMDDILFKNDFVIVQSQSNNGNQFSRPQAWAKNVVSIGGVFHRNTASETDDCWCNGASTGPAADGRNKPDLAYFYDSIFTTAGTANNSYTTGFNGTSAATPITAGHFGIFFQMWHNGLFHNPTGATVFDSRPHMTTAKAMMINTAHQWNPVGTGADITRVRQGWGRADLKNLYDLRDQMFIVNETDVLTNLGSRSYSLDVPAGSTTPLKATLVFADPMGNTASTQSRINDLSLKVTSPSNVVYWGNVGLGGTSLWSTAGGTANTIDTVENVFVQNPEAGRWTVQVIASEVVQDSHSETTAVDADYALVVSGVRARRTTPFDFDGDGKSDVSVFRPSAATWYVLQSNNNSLRTQPWGLGSDSLAPADYDSDGKTDIAVFRPGAAAAFYILQSSDNSLRSQAWGTTGDLPVSADFDGDGKADVAVFRPSTGIWYVLQSNNNSLRAQAFGTSGDTPAAGDFDGDGKADIAVFRASTGSWYIFQSSDSSVRSQPFGTSGDKAVASDYDGDGKADIAVFRPSSGGWYVLQSSNNGFRADAFGISSDRPVPADYDGDGKADLAVFRPSDNNWYILRSSNNSFGIVPFGASGDVPAESAYIP
ncbi:MAG: FG-GAP repeat protein [Acidobacteria bacterium]|nr:FG-GAP repeat protein [Acidobacteriota bacterium]